MSQEARETNEQGQSNSDLIDEVMERLYEKFAPQTVNWRVVTTTKDKQRCLVIPYMDARMVMWRLDQVVGPENWNTEGQLGPDGRAMCTLSVRIGQRWLKRVGVSGFLPQELEKRRNMRWSDLSKGAWAEAFKIAASSLGIGRYLYSEDERWVEYDAERKQISDEALIELGGGGRYNLDDHVEVEEAGTVGKASATGPAPAQEQRQQTTSPRRQPGTHQRDGTPRTAASGPNAVRVISDKQRKALWGAAFSAICARYGVKNVDDIGDDHSAKFMAMEMLKEEFQIDRIEELRQGQFDAAKAYLNQLEAEWKGGGQEEEPDELPPIEDYESLPDVPF